MFTYGQGTQGSIPERVIQKTQKMVLDAALLNSIIRYVSRVKWSYPGKGVVPSPIHRCSSYWKGAFGSPPTTVINFTNIYTYIILTYLFLSSNCVYIYMYMCVYVSVLVASWCFWVRASFFFSFFFFFFKHAYLILFTPLISFTKPIWERSNDSRKDE